MEKWLEIARTGTFTDSAGRPQTFTEADLAAIARAYDPAKRDAPLVFGHPQSDAAPAFGWAQKLRAEGGKLFAQFAQVPGEVRDLVAKGHYRHVSMSLMPDRVTLRHVALLGAAQPAIDGLRAVEFMDGDAAITVNFAADHTAAREGGGPRNGSDAATAFAASNSESRTGRAGERHQKGESMSEELQRQIGQLQAQLEAMKKEQAALKQQLGEARNARDKAESAKTDAEKQAQEASAEFSAYKGKIESERREARMAALVREGRVRPAERESLLEFAARLAGQEGTVDFAAPDGKKEAISMEERFFRELEARPVDERFADFSAPPAHAAQQTPTCDPAAMAAKL